MDRFFLVGGFKIVRVLKFLLGIVLVQVMTGLLLYLSPSELDEMSLLRLVLPLFFLALMVAFWFSSLSDSFEKEKEHKIKNSFAKEREELRVKAEKEKTKVIKQAQKEIAKEAKLTHAKANFKVGASFAGVLGVGALFIFAQMVTAGLLTLTAAGGVMGGYYWRGKRLGGEKYKELEVIDTKVIEQKK
jgi:ABC-type multidrug transport system fused ATPase/permease subunit